MGYSTKRSNRHFLRAMLSRSISSLVYTTVRHKFSIPALRSLANGRWARGLHRNMGAYRAAIEHYSLRRCETNQLLRGPAVRIGPASRLFKNMKHPSENQSQEVLAGLVERVTFIMSRMAFAFCEPRRAAIVTS